MARTAAKVEDLVAEDPEMEAAVGTLLERTDGDGDDVVQWSDVSDDLTSGQWGRLIEKGVLESDGDGFRLVDTEAVREGLEEGEPPEPDDSSWSTYDKLAALASVGLFAGYSIGSVRNAVGETLDVFLGPLESMLPFYVVVLVLALFTGLYSTLLQANLMDMDTMSKYQERIKDLQDREERAKEEGNDEELEKIQEEKMEAMSDNLGMFKEQFRPMVWIMLLTIPVFLWMYWTVGRGGASHLPVAEQSITMPMLGQLDWTENVLGPIQAWIVWYFVCSMGFTQIVRKSLNIQTTPT